MKHPLIYCNDISGNPLKAAPCIAHRKMLLLILSFVALLRSGGLLSAVRGDEKLVRGAPSECLPRASTDSRITTGKTSSLVNIVSPNLTLNLYNTREFLRLNYKKKKIQF